MAVPRPVARTEHLYPTDVFSIALALVFAVLSFLNLGKVDEVLLGLTVDRELLYGTIFLIVSLMLPFLFRLVNPLEHRVVQFLRLFYPQALYLLFYHEAIALSQLFYGGRSLDAVFARGDMFIFGFQPSIRFHQVFGNVAIINELFFFGYFSFFSLMTVGWWIRYATGDISAAVRALSIVTLSFYTLYLFYAFFPVEGPKYYFVSLHREWYGHFKGYLFTPLLQYLFDNVNLAGAAFPSSHVVISTISLLLNRRYNRRLAAFFLPLTVLLYFSTVYLFAHYAVDIIGGLIVAGIFWWTVPNLLDALQTGLERCDSAFARVFRLPPIAGLNIPHEQLP